MRCLSYLLAECVLLFLDTPYTRLLTDSGFSVRKFLVIKNAPQSDYHERASLGSGIIPVTLNF